MSTWARHQPRQLEFYSLHDASPRLPPHSYTQRIIRSLQLHVTQSDLYRYIFVSGPLCGLVVDFIVVHYIDISTGINTICFKSDSCLYPPFAKQYI